MGLPAYPFTGDVGAILLGWAASFFLKLSPSA
jgi:hypothetical protein